MYAAGGTAWQEHVRTEDTKGFVEVIVESPDPQDLGAHWSRLLERPFAPDADGGRIDVDLCNIRLVRAVPGTKERVSGIVLSVRDPAATLARASSRGYAVTADSIPMCGVDFILRAAA